MPRVGGISSLDPYQWIQERKSFSIRLPQEVRVDFIHACIKRPDAEEGSVLDCFFAHFPEEIITFDLSKISPGCEFEVLGFQNGILIAEYTGRATSLELLDVINLRPVLPPINSVAESAY